MNNLFKIILLIFSFNACFFINTNAQKTAIYNNPEAEYSLAIELLDKEKYGAAQQEFVNIIETIKLFPTIEVIHSIISTFYENVFIS